MLFSPTEFFRCTPCSFVTHGGIQNGTCLGPISMLGAQFILYAAMEQKELKKIIISMASATAYMPYYVTFMHDVPIVLTSLNIF